MESTRFRKRDGKDEARAKRLLTQKIRAPPRLRAPLSEVCLRTGEVSPVASVGYPCASGARHTEAYCSSLSWNGTNPGPDDDDDGRGDGVSRRRSTRSDISVALLVSPLCRKKSGALGVP